MIFQDSPVIVENGQTTARIDVKVVGCARMVEIVDNGCHQGREDFQVRHPILKPQRQTQTRLKRISIYKRERLIKMIENSNYVTKITLFFCKNGRILRILTTGNFLRNDRKR